MPSQELSRSATYVVDWNRIHKPPSDPNGAHRRSCEISKTAHLLSQDRCIGQQPYEDDLFDVKRDRKDMTTNRITSLRRWAAIAALAVLTGCAAYPATPAGYAGGYYGAPGYDGWYGYDDLGVLGLDGYRYDHPRDHADRDHHGSMGFHDGGGRPQFVFRGAPGGAFRGVGIAHAGFGHGGFGGHGGGMRG